MYGVQPLDPLSEWYYAPFEAAIVGDKMLSRGAYNAKAGLMTLEARSLAGPRLRKVLGALKIPPCPHMGSCVDDSRTLVTLNAIA